MNIDTKNVLFWFPSSFNKQSGPFSREICIMNYGSNKIFEENSYANFVYEYENGLGFDLSITFCELTLSYFDGTFGIVIA